MSLSAAAQQRIREALAAAVHGERTATAKRLAHEYDISVASVYRIAGRGGTSRPKARREDYREWVRTAAQIAHRSPNAPASLDLAIAAGIACGELPRQAAAMPLATAHRLRREMALVRTDARTQRMDADYPMQALQIDGSSSQHLSVAGRADNGDWLLKLHRRPTPAGGYKNKPLGADRMRLKIYGVWDMCTGYTLSRYCVAQGESAEDALDFFLWAVGSKDDSRIVLRGLPDDLWTDQGALFKSLAAADLLGRMRVNLNLGAPYNKTRQGGVERHWRTLWQRFEPTLFLRAAETITLTALNIRLHEFQIRENARRPSRTPVAGRRATRADAWVALTNARPADNRLRECPPNALATLAREAPRRVDSNGIVRWRNTEYEIPGIHNAWVTVRQSVTDADVIVCETAAGERVDALPLRRRAYGEIKGVPTSTLDQLLADAPDIAPSADLYAPPDQPGSGNLTAMPARVAPAAALDNPLDTSTCAGIEDALALFHSIFPGRLTEAQRALVVAHIEVRDYARSAVVDLANQLAAAAVSEQ